MSDNHTQMSSCAYGVYAYRAIIALYAYTPYAYKSDRVLGVLGLPYGQT